ncbi:hypothetical protein NPIL_585141 [Nephila pilipes]|uniref:Uncharacterized protein n=1 Tax=Nephila pilipes TaxID=299642 RepID=A0A8X6QNM3_NEPPI|nr:hypothetical protein NPIL_585141 [Nephila pilipes]
MALKRLDPTEYVCHSIVFIFGAFDVKVSSFLAGKGHLPLRLCPRDILIIENPSVLSLQFNCIDSIRSVRANYKWTFIRKQNWKLSDKYVNNPVPDVLNDPFSEVNESNEKTGMEGSTTDIPQQEVKKKNI